MHRPEKQTVAKYLPVLAVALTLLAGSCGGNASWTDEGLFDEAIAQADRVVVRDGGFDYDGETGGDAVLLEVTDPKDVGQLRENLVFEKKQQLSVCPCLGYPGVDWYQGEERIALTSIQHGRAVRWIGFQGDVRLTEESGAWLVRWLLEHGVDRAKMQLESEVDLSPSAMGDIHNSKNAGRNGQLHRSTVQGQVFVAKNVATRDSI